MSAFTVTPVAGMGEVTAGTDLAALVARTVGLVHGDVVVVTSKVVSKAEGRVVTLAPGQGRDDVASAEADRVVARRGPTTIVRTRHGLVMAAAGVDTSNTEPGTVVLLPEDPDRSARRLRERLRELTGANVGVLVTDTSGRAWRTGQTDIAIGAAGLVVLDDHAGRTDHYGNPLLVTAPAVADQLAGAAELATGKLSASPVAVVRGLAVVLDPDDHGPGARVLVREEATDMFGYGSREAVLQALDPAGDPRGFGAPAAAEEVAAALRTVVGSAFEVRASSPAALTVVVPGSEPFSRGAVTARLTAAARAHGWVAEGSSDPAEDDDVLSFVPGTP